MFQMNCSACNGLIKSPLLAEAQVIKCPQCEEIVRVQNVIISSRKPSIDLRSTLKNSLLAARDKFRRNKSQVLDEQSSYAINKRLAKLLRRDDFRLDMSYDLYVQIDFDKKKRLARLLNISSVGAGLEFTERGQLPEDNSEINLQLPLPGDAEPLSLPGKVVWRRIPAKETISPRITMGVLFKEVDEDVRACLWDFIAETEASAHT